MVRDGSLMKGAWRVPAAAGDVTVKAHRRPFSHEVAGIIAAAFTLSAVYSIVTTATGVTDDLRNPLLYPVYFVGWSAVALARTNRQWAWWTVAVALLWLIALAIFFYPSLFVPSRQTTFGWFENDVYSGLLILAEYLCIQRLRGVMLVPDA